ncbi:MAG: hypothetical protein IBX55_10680 [Methyloprofundus sp.]|nr:hypothetical protein [Methyloprofundus sp.]
MQKLDRLFDIFSGVSFVRSKQVNLDAVKQTVLTPPDLTLGNVLDETLIQSIDKVEVKISVPTKRWLRTNDIVVVARGTTFRAALITAKLKPEQCLAAQSLVVLRPNHAHPEWCVNLLNSDWFNQTYIQKYHTPKITLNIKELSNYQVHNLDDEQRRALADDFYRTREIVKAAQALIASAKHLNEAKLVNQLKAPN